VFDEVPENTAPLLPKRTVSTNSKNTLTHVSVLSGSKSDAKTAGDSRGTKAQTQPQTQTFEGAITGTLTGNLTGTAPGTLSTIPDTPSIPNELTIPYADNEESP